MKTLTAKVFRVNGQFDIYANEKTVRTQSFYSLAKEMGRDWSAMSKRAKAIFRSRHICKPVQTKIEVFEVEATVPEIFSNHQLQEATIHYLIFPETRTIFLKCKCKNGFSGYETANFSIKQLEDINN